MERSCSAFSRSSDPVVLLNDKEQWATIEDLSERKRIQNKLAQKRHREKKRKSITHIPLPLYQPPSHSKSQQNPDLTKEDMVYADTGHLSALLDEQSYSLSPTTLNSVFMGGFDRNSDLDPSSTNGWQNYTSPTRNLSMPKEVYDFNNTSKMSLRSLSSNEAETEHIRWLTKHVGHDDSIGHATDDHSTLDWNVERGRRALIYTSPQHEQGQAVEDDRTIVTSGSIVESLSGNEVYQESPDSSVTGMDGEDTGAPQTIEMQLSTVLQTISKSGFEDLESMVIAYYTGNFDSNSELGFRQRISRKRHIHSLICALHASMTTREEDESAKWTDAITELAEKVYSSEIRQAYDYRVHQQWPEVIHKVSDVNMDRVAATVISSELTKDRALYGSRTRESWRRTKQTKRGRKWPRVDIKKITHVESLLSVLIQSSASPSQSLTDTLQTMLELLFN